MKIKKLTLSNYCQYAHRVFDFTEGICVLRGKNGTGKSNLINAVFFALTGDSSIEDMSRNTMLSWGKESGYVELEFSVQGNDYVVKRSLEKSTTRLQTPSCTISKSREATAEICKILGADADILKISSFLPQAGTNNLIFGTNNERKLAFSKLFKMQHIESIRTALQKLASRIPKYPDFSGDIKEAEVRILTIKSKLEDLDFMTELYEELTDSESRYDRIKEEVAKGALPKQDVDVALTQCDQAQKELDVSLAEISTKIAALPEICFVPQEQHELYRKYNKAVDTHKDLVELYNKLNSIVLDDVDYATELNNLEKQIQDTQEQHRSAQAYVTSCEAGTCEACGQTFQYSEEDLIRTRQLVQTLAQQLVSLRTQQQSLRTTQQGASSKKAIYNQMELDYAKLSEEYAALSEEIAAFDLSAYNTQVTLAKQSESILMQKEELTQQQQEILQQQAQLKNTRASWEAQPTQSEDFSEEFLQEYESKNIRYTEAYQEYNQYSSELSIREENLGKWVEKESKSVVAKKSLKFIEDLRNILHVNNYPRLAMQVFRKSLMALINKYLEIFDTPFKVIISKELEFLCAFPDNPSVPAKQALSGGQKGMLVVATRLAIAEMLATRVELLTFDEPGAAMDTEARQDMLIAFEAIKSRLVSNSIQILLASHDAHIESVADSVINT
jgi:DNA repair exonuclease SbcCD ATPase subunit